MSAARSSTLRWREIAGSEMANGAASSLTVRSLSTKRARIARLVGSASAAKAPIEIESSHHLIDLLINRDVKCNVRRSESTHSRNSFCSQLAGVASFVVDK